MTKIRCGCCHGVAQVDGKHEFQAMKGCRNGTFIETAGAGNPRIGGRNQALIKLWDEEKKSYEPLMG